MNEITLPVNGTNPSKIQNLKSKIIPWLMPRPFALVTTITYLYLAGAVSLTPWCDSCAPWRTWAVIASFLILIGLDRLDYRLYGETPPLKAGIVLFAIRVLLVEW